MYAKLTQNGIEYAPVNKGGVINFGTKANQPQLLELGYLPVVDGSAAQTGENQILRAVFTQETDRIVRSFEAVDPEPDPLTGLMLAIAELAEALFN